MSVRSNVVLLAIAASSATASAQTAGPRDAVKRALLTSISRPACPVAATSPPATNETKRAQARDLVSRGQQAAILGDTAAALSRLREAEALDPTDADLAYQLARLYEGGGTNERAVAEYCRFLTLTPNGADAADARGRVAVLAKPVADPAIDSANAAFRQGLAAYDAGKFSDAVARFSLALTSEPSWPDAYFDRAVARQAQGDRPQAASDFETYLRLKTAAEDRALVSRRIDLLRRPGLSSGVAFGVGIVIPGGGQFYTGHPAWGTALLLGAGGAVGFALVPQEKTTTVQQTATDPFGNTYTYSATRRTKDRTYLVPGVAAAGAITLIGAIQAALHAAGGPDAEGRLSMLVSPGRTGLALRMPF